MQSLVLWIGLLFFLNFVGNKKTFFCSKRQANSFMEFRETTAQTADYILGVVQRNLLIEHRILVLCRAEDKFEGFMLKKKWCLILISNNRYQWLYQYCPIILWHMKGN